jgi:hypothetical protein
MVMEECAAVSLCHSSANNLNQSRALALIASLRYGCGAEVAVATRCGPTAELVWRTAALGCPHARAGGVAVHCGPVFMNPMMRLSLMVWPPTPSGRRGERSIKLRDLLPEPIPQ